MDNVPGPRFTCNMLSETSCEDPCDWHTAFEVPKDLSRCEHLSYETLLGYDAFRGVTDESSDVLQLPYILKFVTSPLNLTCLSLPGMASL